MYAPFVLTPAYGRDYKSKAALEKDLLAGKDFTANSPGGTTYTNLQDLQEAGITKVQVRYDSIRKSTVVNVPKVAPAATT